MGPQSEFPLGGALRRPLSGQGRTGIANHLHAPQATGPLPSSLPLSQYEGLQALALWEACGRRAPARESQWVPQQGCVGAGGVGSICMPMQKAAHDGVVYT